MPTSRSLTLPSLARITF
ncbi:hypothetical protein E2C01_059835 [Portunus trituberculatus]|uniref:Uncharacterized protein n=1 Tax=Portunus trituberculatus TaxID=210409 RepID=A0A5B7H7A6_PORTR|nr:hypothetical protein [Portunus trituberculatus]